MGNFTGLDLSANQAAPGLAVGGSSLPCPQNINNQFTRANVVGIFLTLQFCQLTQPYGSLLFRETGGFLWRCNPIASLTESVIIFWYLSRAVLQGWRDERSNFVKRLQQTASALLLLRGAMSKDSTAGLMSKLMTGSFLDRNEASQVEQRELDQVNQTSSEASGSNVPGSDPSRQDEQLPRPVARQGTLESQRAPQRSHTLAAFDLRSEKSQILRDAFGSNALAHKELRVDAFTTVAVLFAFVKLVAVRGSPWLTVGGLFLVVGWASVHLLLILFHLRELDEIEMGVAVRLTRIFNDELKTHVRERWMTVFISLHLPLVGYPAYQAAFHPLFSQQHPIPFSNSLPRAGAGFFPGLAVVWEAFGLVFAIAASSAIAMATIFWGLFWVTEACLAGKTLSSVLFFLIWVWSVFATVSHALQEILVRETTPESPTGDFKGIFDAGTMGYYLIDAGPSFLLKVVWLVMILGAMAAVYYYSFFAPGKPDRLARGCVVAGNLLCISVMFAILLYRHEETQTFKPWWIELLG